MTTIYLAVSGEYSDSRVCHAFSRREDAESYKLGVDVRELELHDGPVEVREWHMLWWRTDLPDRETIPGFANANPYESFLLQDFNGDERYCRHDWKGAPATSAGVLTVQGWNLDQVRKVYSEQRAQYLAGKEGIA